MTGYTVAVKFADEPVKLCGFSESRKTAECARASLKESWLNARSTATRPTSIRVREVTENEWATNNSIKVLRVK